MSLLLILLFFYIVDHRVVISFETVDFFPATINRMTSSSSLARVQDAEDCDSSAFVAFWLGPNQVLCLDVFPNFLSHSRRRRRQRRDLGHGGRNRRSIGDLLEKTKYSLVANTSNYHISELVSSGNKLVVRFFAKQGRLPGRGFRAKFKIPR